MIHFLLPSLGVAGGAVAPQIFKIEKNGKTSYLLGTVHYGVGLGEFPSWVEKLHRQTSVHVYERNLQGKDLKILGEVFSKPEVVAAAMSSPGADTLSPSDRDRVIQLGIPEVIAQKMSYGKCHELLMMSHMAVSGEGYKSVDHELFQNSMAEGKRIVSLETRADQVSAEKKAGDRPCRINKALLDLLSDPLQPHPYDFISQWYGDKDFPKRGDIALRNKKWILDIAKVAESGDGFISVGFLHLFGDQGLIEMLKRRGFEVEPVKSGPEDLVPLPLSTEEPVET